MANVPKLVNLDYDTILQNGKICINDELVLERKYKIVDLSDAFYESGFNMDELLKYIGIKKGFCCDYYKLNYEHGVEDVTEVPTIQNPHIMKKVCSHCGKDPEKYTKERVD